ncbi:MAG: hypothetical protein V1826_00160 [bacterium]
MQDDKWGEILDKIEGRFDVLDQGEEAVSDIPNARREFVVFESPLGKIRFERTTKPRVEGIKTFGGHKHGTASGVEKIYSDSEQVKVFQAFKEVDGEWQPIDAEGLVQ